MVGRKIVEMVNIPNKISATLKSMSISCLMRGRLSLIGIGVIYLLRFVCLLMRTMTIFLRCNGYLNFIKDQINRALLLIVVRVLLFSCLYLTSCLTTIKNQVIKYCEQVYERNGKNLFLYIKNPRDFLKIVCLHKISLLSVLHCFII